jgi:hypothetical protein
LVYYARVQHGVVYGCGDFGNMEYFMGDFEDHLI